MSSLSTADTPGEVRNALDLRLTVDNLPDEVIQQPIFRLEAEEAVLAADPAALTYTDPSTALDRVRRATTYLTAALIAPVLPNLTQLQLGDTRFSWEAWDGAARAAQLRSLAAAALALNTEADGQVPFMEQFQTAPGFRGR